MVLECPIHVVELQGLCQTEQVFGFGDGCSIGSILIGTLRFFKRTNSVVCAIRLSNRHEQSLEPIIEASEIPQHVGVSKLGGLFHKLSIGETSTVTENRVW